MKFIVCVIVCSLLCVDSVVWFIVMKLLLCIGW